MSINSIGPNVPKSCPKKPFVGHKAEKGDTLNKIYGFYQKLGFSFTLKELQQANPKIKGPNQKIDTGKLINIPFGAKVDPCRDYHEFHDDLTRKVNEALKY